MSGSFPATARGMANVAYVAVACALVGAVMFGAGYMVGQRGPLAESRACIVPATCTVNITLTNSTLGLQNGDAPCTHDARGQPLCTFVGPNTTWVCGRDTRYRDSCNAFNNTGVSA